MKTPTSEWVSERMPEWCADHWLNLQEEQVSNSLLSGLVGLVQHEVVQTINSYDRSCLRGTSKDGALKLVIYGHSWRADERRERAKEKQKQKKQQASWKKEKIGKLENWHVKNCEETCVIVWRGLMSLSLMSQGTNLLFNLDDCVFLSSLLHKSSKNAQIVLMLDLQSCTRTRGAPTPCFACILIDLSSYMYR